MKKLIALAACLIVLAACLGSDTLEAQASLELCDGVDNDGDPETRDGADESWIGEPCGPAPEYLGVSYCVDGLVVCAPGSEYQ